MKTIRAATPALGKWAKLPGELLCQAPCLADTEMSQMWSRPCKNANLVQEASDGTRSDASREPRGLWGLAQLGEQ